MTADAGQNGRLETATKRLGRAMAMLEQRLARKAAEAGAQADGVIDQDRANLAAQLDAARGRERALQEAGSLASKALAGAIADLHAALGSEAP